jgi:hypothetical protein
MPKLSLWHDKKNNDYSFTDSIVKEYFYVGGTGVLLHKYMGPQGKDATETSIQDVLFLENRSRKYSDDLIEMRGVYKPEDAQFDLSQFGIFLSNDTIFISFHYTSMMNSVGRKLMSGDVLELQHLRDPDSLSEDRATINRLFVIEDASHSADGYGPNWWSHIWKVKAKIIKDSPEFSDILGYGPDAIEYDENGNFVGMAGSNTDLKVSQSTECKELGIMDAIIEMAEDNVKFDPKFNDASHLYVDEISTGQFNYYMWSGDGIPPNGKKLKGSGVSFPHDMAEGDFYLRIDYTPPRLFRKHGAKFVKIEDDIRLKWTAYNTIMDTFIDNKETDTMSDGTVAKTKQALSKAVKPKVDMQKSKLDEIKRNK